LWFEHLVLLAAVLETYIGLDPSTVQKYLPNLHCRWRFLFPAYELTSWASWHPEKHLPRSLADPQVADTLQTRAEFFRGYTVVAEYSQAYWRALPKAEQALYQQWILPLVPKQVTNQYARRPEIIEAQKARRKRETDALTPHLAKIRGEAHLRWNALKRLRSTFQEALARISSGQETVPLAFSYEEPNRGERLYFIVWDRPRFVLAHAQHYRPSPIARAKKQAKQQDREQAWYFLEFVHAQPLASTGDTASAPEGPFWFGDLLRCGWLRDHPFRGDLVEVERQRSYLESWGYLSEDEEMARAPFRTSVAGLLTSPKAQIHFLIEAQRHTQKIRFEVEPLFAAATFGLTGLDLLTTTGMRITEMVQVNLTPQCLHTVVVEGAKRLVMEVN
jgi:hypothetical protein